MKVKIEIDVEDSINYLAFLEAVIRHIKTKADSVDSVLKLNLVIRLQNIIEEAIQKQVPLDLLIKIVESKKNENR